MRTSHSTESVLRDSSPPPPPKPPLPHRVSNPPPLPPKRRSAGNRSAIMDGAQLEAGDGVAGSSANSSQSGMLLSCGLDR